MTPLHLAAFYGQAMVAVQLVERGSDLVAVSSADTGALYIYIYIYIYVYKHVYICIYFFVCVCVYIIYICVCIDVST